MYHSSAVRLSPREEEDERRRDKRIDTNVQQLPSYSARSPKVSHYHGYSPTNGTLQQPGYGNAYSSRPSSAAAMQMSSSINQSPRLGPPPSPTNGSQHLSRASYTSRDQKPAYYYDPTSEHREGALSWNHSPYAGRSPIHVSLCRHPLTLNTLSRMANRYDTSSENHPFIPSTTQR